MRPTLLAALIALAAAAALAAPALATAADSWRPPVEGVVARGFDVGPHPFAAGQHRGADFAASPGARVSAPCAGRVAHAGRVGEHGGVVTLRCGPWRVTHMPLAGLAVAAGESVARGERLGSVASGTRGHAGLHLGVRREGRRFGYVDPLGFLGAAPPPPPVVVAPPARRGPRPGPARRARPPRPARRARPPRPARRAPPARPAPLITPAHRGSSRVVAPGPDRVAPWPAWLGLGLLLAGAVGAGARLAAPRRRAPAPRPLAERVR